MSKTLPDSPDSPDVPGRGKLIANLVALVVIGMLASTMMANLTQTPTRSKEAVLKNNLYALRQVLDRYSDEKGYDPATLDALVDDGYLRQVPTDPMTGSHQWGLLPGDGAQGIIDVYSLSEKASLDGTPYAEW